MNQKYWMALVLSIASCVTYELGYRVTPTILGVFAGALLFVNIINELEPLD